MSTARLKTIARKLLPPIVVDAARWARGAGQTGDDEWEHVPEGWARPTRGWNVSEVVEAYRQRWPAFVAGLQGTRPFGRSHESPVPTTADYGVHNTIASFGYVAALAAHQRDRISMLDLGGGIGHYYALARTLVPGVTIDYTAADLPLLCAHGRTLFPEARFCDDDTWSEGRYDLVLCSAALQYRERWRETVARLRAATLGHLYITRVPMVERAPSFVVLQRAQRYGYGTEYLGWFFNREELLGAVADATLVREFLIDERPYVKGAPEQGDYRGFLFRPSDAAPGPER